MIVLAFYASGLHGDGHQDMAQQLTRALVKTHHGSARIVGPLINVQNALHAPQIVGGDGSDTPLLL